MTLPNRNHAILDEALQRLCRKGIVSIHAAHRSRRR